MRPCVKTVVLAFVLLLAAPLAMSQERAAARYLSGGVGEESRATLQGQASTFDLRVVYADKSGAYLSAVLVEISDAAGRPVLETTTDGPWLFVQLAPGDYRMRASINGETQERSFTIPALGSRELVFHFRQMS